MSESIPYNEMIQIISDQTKAVKEKIQGLKSRGDEISIGEMFELQMLMNQLSQLSEMSTQVVSAANGAIIAIARNVK